MKSGGDCSGAGYGGGGRRWREAVMKEVREEGGAGREGW